MAVEAGADLLLYSMRFEWQSQAIEAVVSAVEQGRISPDRIDRSVEKLLALKSKRGLFNRMAGDEAEDLSIVGCEPHRETARRISEAGITLVKNDHALLPLAKTKTLVIHFAAAAVSEADEAYANAGTLGKALAGLGFDVVEHVLPIQHLTDEHRQLAADAGTYGQIVIGTYNATFYKEQSDLVNAIYEQNRHTIVVALRNPYDIAAFPRIPAYVAAYESRPLAIRSAAKLLAGQIRAQGKLPVSIGESFPRGWGL
jgi:beta-N-acetylhexosaminidase